VLLVLVCRNQPVKPAAPPCPQCQKAIRVKALAGDAERRDRIRLALAYIHASTQDLRAIALSVQQHAAAVAHKKAANGS
jgi:hypothetical protein